MPDRFLVYHLMHPLSCTLIQTDLQWEDPAANRLMLEKKVRAITDKAELVILPEMFTTGFSMHPRRLAETMEGETVQWMRQLAAERKIILTGSVIITENGHFYNRLLWVLPNGQTGHYDKRHRFAYAGEDAEYTAGNRRMIARVNGWRINVQVCYDLRFPVWARQQPGETPEYDILLYVANWPERRIHAWKSLLTARAIENQCYVLGVNRVGNDGNGIYHSGDSLVIDPLGQTLYQKTGEEDIHTIQLDPSRLEKVREQYPFWKDADQFHIHTGHED